MRLQLLKPLPARPRPLRSSWASSTSRRTPSPTEGSSVESPVSACTGAGTRRGGCGHRRRGRRVHAARRGSRSTTSEELRRVIPVIERLAARSPFRCPSTPANPRSCAARSAAGASLVNDVRRCTAPGALAAVADKRRGSLPDAHAGRAPHDAGRAALRRCRRRGARLPEGACCCLRARRHSSLAPRGRSRFRLRQVPRTQPRTPARAARARIRRTAGARRPLAQDA